MNPNEVRQKEVTDRLYAEYRDITTGDKAVLLTAITVIGAAINRIADALWAAQ